MRKTDEKHHYIVRMSNNLRGARRDLSEFKDLLNRRNNFTCFCKTNFNWVEMFVVLRLLEQTNILLRWSCLIQSVFLCYLRHSYLELPLTSLLLPLY